MELTGSHVPFLCIASDIWDSKDGEWLGTTISWTFPTTFEHVEIPVLLCKCSSKKAVDVADLISSKLGRWGVTNLDPFRGVNDTTNSALQTGRQIAKHSRLPDAGKQSSPWVMHTIDLI